MEINKTTEGSTLNIAVSGEVNSGNADQLTAVLSNLEGMDLVNLDLAQMTFISSAGLRALIMAEKTMKDKSGKMVVTHVQPDVMEIFDMTGFSKILTIE